MIPSAITTLISTRAAERRCRAARGKLRTSTIAWTTPDSSSTGSAMLASALKRPTTSASSGVRCSGASSDGGAAQREHEHGDPAEPGAHREHVQDVRGQQDRDRRLHARVAAERRQQRERAERDGERDEVRRRDGRGAAGRRGAGGAPRRRRRAVAVGRRAAAADQRGSPSGVGAALAARPQRARGEDDQRDDPQQRADAPGAAEAGAEDLADGVRLGGGPERAALADGALQDERGDRGERSRRSRRRAAGARGGR